MHATLLSSCSTSNDVVEEEKYSTIDFCIEGLSVTQTRSNSILQSDVDDLYVTDWNGVEYCQSKSFGYDDFDNVSITLSHGQHEVYFVASNSIDTEYSTEESTATQSEVKDTFFGNISLDVSSSTSPIQYVTLERCTYYVQFVAQDDIPSSVSSATITISNHYNSVSWIDGYARGNDESYSKTFQIDHSIGATCWGVYGFAKDETDYITARIDFYDDNGTLISFAEKDEVPVSRKCITNIRGNLFSKNTGLSIMIDSSWEGSYDIDI